MDPATARALARESSVHYAAQDTKLELARSAVRVLSSFAYFAKSRAEAVDVKTLRKAIRVVTREA